MRLRWIGYCLVLLVAQPARANEALVPSAIRAMEKAARFFRTEVATNGGYLWHYKSDFSLREGEVNASATTVWVQPPGTPSVGMAFLEAYEATGDTLFLNGAVEAARALCRGQLASGGWDYRIDFDPEQSARWHYRRDVEAGDADTGNRRNHTTLDDNNTQSALLLLMRVDKALDFKDAEIHRAAHYALAALLKTQYPNGAWPQRFREFPDPDDFPVKKARYPETWSREFPSERYDTHYTLNDNSIADVIATMVDGYKTYGDARFLDAAKRGGDFLILAQMPDPQPAWAQQYNADMEPVWARRFEPPSITGGETFGAMRALLDLYVETGEGRFLAPVPRALAWAKRSLLPDGQMARFYELQTNKPLYFTMDYVLTHDDSDMPTHYAFKVSGNRIESTEAYYNRIHTEGREAVLAERNRISTPDPQQVHEVVRALDDRGRWLDQGRLKTPTDRNQHVEAEIISTRTFNRNLTLLARYVRSEK